MYRKVGEIHYFFFLSKIVCEVYLHTDVSVCRCVLIPLEPEWQAHAGSHCPVMVVSCPLAAEPSLPPQSGT